VRRTAPPNGSIWNGIRTHESPPRRTTCATPAPAAAIERCGRRRVRRLVLDLSAARRGDDHRTRLRARRLRS